MVVVDLLDYFAWTNLFLIFLLQLVGGASRSGVSWVSFSSFGRRFSSYIFGIRISSFQEICVMGRFIVLIMFFHFFKIDHCSPNLEVDHFTESLMLFTPL